MSRKLFFVLVISIFLSSLLYVGLNPIVESTNNYPVRNEDTGLHYATIQEAINANETLDGHIIGLDLDVFWEHIVINKSVRLYGSFWIGHPEVITTINGNGTGTVVTVETDDVGMHGIKIANGINGIVLEEADNCFLASLYVVDNAETGIYLRDSRNCTLEYSHIADNRYNLGVEGSSAEHFFHKMVSSTANGKPIHYLTNEQDKNMTEDAGYIAAINCTNITIENQNLTNNHQGLLFAYTNNSIIRNINISNNLYGIYIQNSNNNTIFYNNFTNNTYQVHVEAIDEYPSNTWDDGVGKGNYWSDYEDRYPDAEEIDDSGIWDTPYFIDENNQDSYPIVPEFPKFLILPIFMIATLLAVARARYVVLIKNKLYIQSHPLLQEDN